MILIVEFDAPIPLSTNDFEDLHERIKVAVHTSINNRCVTVSVTQRHETIQQPGYLGFSQLTETNRADLCDIAWFLKGLKQGNPDIPLMGCHDESLRKVIMSIADRIDADKNKINGK